MPGAGVVRNFHIISGLADWPILRPVGTAKSPLPERKSGDVA